MSSDKSQAEKFKEAARQIETDDDEERFEKRLKRLVKKPLTDESASDSVVEDGGDS